MDYKHINVNNIGYSRPLHTKKGFNVVVNYAGKKPITITTPLMMCPYGIDKKKDSPGNCTMKLLITDDIFLETLQNIDARNLEITDEWFSKDNSDENSDDEEDVFYFTPLIKNTLRVRIPIKNERRYDVNVTSDICGEGDDKELLTVDDIVPGTHVKCVLEWKHIWIIDKTYGYFWTVKDIEIQKINDI